MPRGIFHQANKRKLLLIALGPLVSTNTARKRSELERGGYNLLHIPVQAAMTSSTVNVPSASYSQPRYQVRLTQY